MFKRRTTAAVVVSVVGLLAGDVLAQGVSVESSAIPKDITVMQQLLNALPPKEKGLSQPVRFDYGPLLYRLSTAQGQLFQSTNLPYVVRLNPDDGLSDKILGGLPAKVDKFPWQVALLNSTYGTIFCGGSHVGGGWIVTAAHCVVDKFGQSLKNRDILVLAGSVSLISGGTRLQPVQEPIFHEQYDPDSQANDIALLRVPSNSILPTVQIPVAEVEAPLVSENANLTVSGWGLTTDGGSISTELLEVGVPVIAPQQCLDVYPGIIASKQICAGASGRDSCQGDSGGPITGLDGNGRVLVGIVSFGKGCGRAGYPGVYTRAVAYKDWIKQKSGI